MPRKSSDRTREPVHGVPGRCDMLQLDSGRKDPMTEIIVMKIVELAKTGEHDPVQVSERVLAELVSSHSADAA